MDKSWIHLKNRWCGSYVNGVKQFILFAKTNANGKEKIQCPCQRCNNMYFREFNVVEDHLYIHGMTQGYFQWFHHGESFEFTSGSNNDHSAGVGHEKTPNRDFVYDILEDVWAGEIGDADQDDEFDFHSSPVFDDGPEKFTRLVRDADCELYPGCKMFSKLSFLINLLHVKTMHKLSNKSCSMLLDLIKKALPAGETLPKSYYEAQNLMRDLGLNYTTIHACKYDCALFWKEYENREECPICGTSRWKSISKTGKKIPHKVRRYLPLKPRLQRLYMRRKTAFDMRWHKETRVEEKGVSRHPADSIAWKEFDKEHEWFSRDPRNVRLGLASDGFNPFGNMSTTYSMWPVILTPYNLPPWMCMKEPFLILSSLIPGPSSPGNDIDVYLQPLVDELKDLWHNGVSTYDAYLKQTFRLHAAVLWTINDFSAYGMLSGWSTKGKLACPVCNAETCSMTLKNGQKQCYLGHRRFLNSDHKWRKSNKFNGKHETRLRPKELSGDDVLRQLDAIPNEVRFGKHPNKKKRKRSESELNWTKKSIFFELPYWKTLKLRHNLDVMHIEKNILESILGTLMNIDGKTKDTAKSRMDLEFLGIRKELHLQRDGDRIVIPPACYTLALSEKRRICQWLKSVKFPDGYASNISRCVNVADCKISGMKSHDFHVMLQLLPIALRGFLSKEVCFALTELSLFFKELCSETLRLQVLEQLERDIALILCKLELIFPPSFFDVMVHLAIHLAHEAIIAGPVRYRWMYPIERFLRTLKDSVRNKAHPEGSIVEAYIDKECLTFCSMYLTDSETRFNREERNYDGGQVHLPSKLPLFTCNARPLGAVDIKKLNLEDYSKARWYILNNCIEVESYLQKHKEEIQEQSPMNVEQRHQSEFPSWFEKHMIQLRKQNSPEATNDLYSLALGPDRRVTRCSGCIVNGTRFHTRDRERVRTTQNSGIVVKGEYLSEDTDFYGILIDIIELKYNFGNRVYLFKCQWRDVSDKREGIRKDQHFISVNATKTWYTNEPFVLASQARQVYYLDDPKHGGSWQIVQKIHTRNLFDVPEVDEEDDSNDETFQQVEVDGVLVQVDDREVTTLLREDLAAETVDQSVIVDGNCLDEGNLSVTDDEVDEEDDTMADYCTDKAQEDEFTDDDESDIDSML
ncbi:hypothetical protein Vadar_006468 [Vaccinium darrowii]|uniref:Uncharacterized protein n=1 Tax=Vaccinium darrowii TaxID=229202 RepID=A0ACB7XXX1_9ERIC|nr:hypothetical protein Vadar_006468 [Vaccinium darrowii]